MLFLELILFNKSLELSWNFSEFGHLLGVEFDFHRKQTFGKGV